MTGSLLSYFDGSNSVSTSSELGKTEYKTELILEKDPGISLLVFVSNKKTGEPIKDVKSLITEAPLNSEVINGLTPDSGSVRKPLSEKKVGDCLIYTVIISKEGFLTKTVAVNMKIMKPGEILLYEMFEITMDKIEIGEDIGKIFNLNPIYFNLSKWVIRKDAALKLNKIVAIMNENPKLEIELGSHTDCRSSATFNLTLSEKRARSSSDYIKERITIPERITGKGYGETILVNKCECEGSRKVPCTEEEHQANRRTEFKVIK